MRTEPPMSVPSSKLVNPAATAAAAPPDDPPVMRSSVPRVVGDAEELVVGLHVARPPRQVGLAEHDGAGGLEAGDGGCVLGGHVVGELRGATGRADALGLDGVLDRDRQTVERPEHVAAEHGDLVGRVGGGARPLDVEGDDRVHVAVEALDAVEVEVEQLTARDCGAGGGSPPRACVADQVAALSSTRAAPIVHRRPR